MYLQAESVIIATLLISLLQFRDRTGIDSRIFENGRNEGGVEKMRKEGNNQAIRGGQFWLKSFSCEIRAGGGGERLMRDNKFAPKINPPTSEPKPRRVYIKHERELFMISHIEFGYRNLCKGVRQISKFKLQDLYLRGRVYTSRK